LPLSLVNILVTGAVMLML